MNWGIRVLQTLALPLGYVAIGAGDEARTRYLHLGKVALYQMSYARNYVREKYAERNYFTTSSEKVKSELDAKRSFRGISGDGGIG